MGKMNPYFLDTYALIEISKNNPNFRPFNKSINCTSYLNLLEFTYIVSRDFGIKKAEKIAEKITKIISGIKFEDVKRASEFRLKKGKKKFSYIDCLGYAMAKNRKAVFVTGDKEFENIKNVEFVK